MLAGAGVAGIGGIASTRTDAVFDSDGKRIMYAHVGIVDRRRTRAERGDVASHVGAESSKDVVKGQDLSDRGRNRRRRLEEG